ncbi:DUF6069 family protein [Actinomadura monticuli]|uniref:DUF6069 family protein n=1 Tax=Actinomadura monticuli TaxID=3097367 RepID=A0ABV4QLL1_9ACTN
MSGDTPTRQAPTRQAPAPGTRARRALAVGAAAVAALALWALTGPVLGLDPAAGTGGRTEPVGAGMVAAAALAAGLAGWALLALLERAARRPRRTWTAIAAVFLALSLAGPLGSAADAASLGVLAAMHLLVGAVLIPGLGRSARTR